jgi:hypothetical protein
MRVVTPQTGGRAGTFGYVRARELLVPHVEPSGTKWVSRRFRLPTGQVVT